MRHLVKICQICLQVDVFGQYTVGSERSTDEINLSICDTSDKVILKRTGYINLERDHFLDT